MTFANDMSKYVDSEVKQGSPELSVAERNPAIRDFLAFEDSDEDDDYGIIMKKSVPRAGTPNKRMPV